LRLLEALLDSLLKCLEELECQEDQDQGCQEADTATQDVFVSTCPTGLKAPGCPRCQDQDQDQDQELEAQDLEAQDLEAQELEAQDLVATAQARRTAPVVLPSG